MTRHFSTSPRPRTSFDAALLPRSLKTALLYMILMLMTTYRLGLQKQSRHLCLPFPAKQCRKITSENNDIVYLHTTHRIMIILGYNCFEK